MTGGCESEDGTVESSSSSLMLVEASVPDGTGSYPGTVMVTISGGAAIGVPESTILIEDLLFAAAAVYEALAGEH